MTRRVLIFIILIIGIAGVLIFINQEEEKKDQVEEKEEINEVRVANENEFFFNIEDTASITKIIISDLTPKSITIKREAGYWSLNDTLKHRKDHIDDVLDILYRMRKQSDVKDSELNLINSWLETKRTKVEVFLNNENEPVKTIYIGLPTQDSKATFMKLKGAKRPYVVHIPNENRHLNPSFSTDIIALKSTEVFSYPRESIQSVEVIHSSDSVKSFRIDLSEEGGYDVYTLPENEKLENAKPYIVKDFMGLFSNLNYYDDLAWEPQPRKDSIKALAPDYIFRVTDKNNKTSELRSCLIRYRDDELIELPDNVYKPDNMIPGINYNPDAMYAVFNDKDIYMIQFNVFRKIMVGADFFVE
jgi:hypothetical protein